MIFSDIIGLQETKQTLIGSVQAGHIAHAQLFIGNPGSANLAMAFAYAQYINCEEKLAEDSCGNCSSCIQYRKLVNPDLHLVFPMATLEKVSKEELKPYLLKHFREFALAQPYASIHEWGTHVGAENKQFNIPVEEGRNIIQSISLKAYQSEYKVVIIWLPELMSGQTANAILKVLEEPPAKTLFLLVANDYEKLLATIISRCQMIRIRSFDEQEIIKFLVSKNICDDKSASRIAKIADGDMGRAIALSNEVHDDNHQLFTNWVRMCFGQKYAELLIFCDELSKKGRENQKNMLLYGIQIMRDALINKLNLVELIRQDQEEMIFIQNFSKAIEPHHVEYIYEMLNETYQHIERNGNAKIVFFDTSIKIGAIFKNAKK